MNTWHCEWYLLCDNDAVGTTPHPALGEVFICQRCADKHALPVTPFEDDDDAGPDPVWHRYQ